MDDDDEEKSEYEVYLESIGATWDDCYDIMVCETGVPLTFSEWLEREHEKAYDRAGEDVFESAMCAKYPASNPYFPDWR